LSENKGRRAEIVWFGFVSERSFRLKTTLHIRGGVLVVDKGRVENSKTESWGSKKLLIKPIKARGSESWYSLRCLAPLPLLEKGLRE